MLLWERAAGAWRRQFSALPRSCTPARSRSRASKLLGVAYLLYMAWTALKQHGPLKVAKDVGVRSAGQVSVHAILINVLNPKLSIFFFAFLPQFVSGREPHPLPRMLELSAVFMGLTFVVFVGYGLFAAKVRAHVISRPRVLGWMRRSFAAAFVALGAKIAFAAVSRAARPGRGRCSP